MSYRIVAALALSFGLSTAAMAQTDATTNGQIMLPMGWEGTIAETFFSDTTTGTLKSDEEIHAGWAALSAEQQAQVRSDCETHLAAADPVETDTMAGAEATTEDDELETGAVAETDTDAAAPVGDPIVEANLTQLCNTVQGM
jgi:hypothetical protein